AEYYTAEKSIFSQENDNRCGCICEAAECVKVRLKVWRKYEIIGQKGGSRMNIAVLSDTHGILRPEAAAILRNCDAALHAGDIDTPETLGQIRAALKPGVPFYVVRGNNDREWVRELPEYAAFSLGGIRFYMAHRKKDIPE